MNLAATKAFLATSMVLLLPCIAQAESNPSGSARVTLPLNHVPGESTKSDYATRSSKADRLVNYTTTFPPRGASGQTSTKWELWELDGKFNSLVQLTKSSSDWKATTILGLLDLLINVEHQDNLEHSTVVGQADTVFGSLAIKGNFNQKLKFAGSNASWQSDTLLGKFVLQGNFNQRANFSGGQATWNTQTAMGSLAVKGNFAQTDFTGGTVKVATDAFIGSLAADIKLDEATNFSGANASWKANLFLGSSIRVKGKFDQNTSFTGGSIRLGAKSALGVWGIKANVDRLTQFTSGSAVWQTRAGGGTIGLQAELKQDGNYQSALSIKFPL